MKSSNLLPAELLEKIKSGEKVVVIDVRDTEKFQQGTMEHPGIAVTNLPYVEMMADAQKCLEDVDNLPKDAVIVTLCTTGNKAQKAAEFFHGRGLNAVALEGGLTNWNDSSS